MKVIMTVAKLGDDGVGVTTKGLAEAVAAEGVSVAVFFLSRAGAQAKPDMAGVRGVACATVREMKRKLEDELTGRTRSVIHNHGLWLGVNHSGALLARKRCTPLLCSPHGMLRPWAISHKRWKKKLAWWLYQRADLRCAAALHATSPVEAQEFRRLGLENPIAIVPNGISIPPWQEPCQRTGPRTVLFLGRIHLIKGLLTLVSAWAKVRPAGWRCVIAGPDQGGHQAQVEAAITREKLETVFEVTGPVLPEGKWALFHSAHLFVLPSVSENFAVVVAEALAASVPVITTKGTPWEELVTHQCGWWVDIGAEPLEAALREAMALSDEQRQEMGQRGRRLVAEKYAWPKIALQMKSVYEWVLGGGPKPHCVVLR